MCDKSCRLFEEDRGLDRRRLNQDAYHFEYDLYGDPEQYLKAAATATITCKKDFGPIMVRNQDLLEVQSVYYPKIQDKPYMDRLTCITGSWVGSVLECRRMCAEYVPSSGRVAVYSVGSKGLPVGEDITDKPDAGTPMVLHGVRRMLRCKGDTNKRSGFFPAEDKSLLVVDTSLYEEITCLDGQWTPSNLVCMKRCNPTFTAVLRKKCEQYHTENVHSPCNKALSMWHPDEWKEAILDHEKFVTGIEESEEAESTAESTTPGENSDPDAAPISSAEPTSRVFKKDTDIYKCGQQACIDNSPYKIIRSILRNNPTAYDKTSGVKSDDDDLLDRARLHGDVHVVTCNKELGFAPAWSLSGSLRLEQTDKDIVGTVECVDGKWTELPFQCDRGCEGPFDMYDPSKNQWLPLFTQNSIENYLKQAKASHLQPLPPQKKKVSGPLAEEEVKQYLKSHDQVGRAERAPSVIWKTEAQRFMGIMAAPWYPFAHRWFPQIHGDLDKANSKRNDAITNMLAQMNIPIDPDALATDALDPIKQLYIQRVNETIPLYRHWAVWGPGCCDPTNCWRGLWGDEQMQCGSRWWGRGSWVAFERLENGKREDSRDVYYSFCNAGGTWVPTSRVSSGNYPQDSVQTAHYHTEEFVLDAVPDKQSSEEFFFSEPILPTLVDPRRLKTDARQVMLKDIRGDNIGKKDFEVVEDPNKVKLAKENT
eukprot:GHVR01166519.1.p1 GENE.GHVR01166519.1~~GHVR01166519.1.p1  ORF type:complete len:706 (+),score=148.32 GHVR01166519.1:382-2499(+)